MYIPFNTVNTPDNCTSKIRTPIFFYSTVKSQNSAKPFLKWAGGKSQLLKKVEKHYPFDNKKVTKYAEPFVGGGAVLFDILNKYDLEAVYISDINAELINTYSVIKNSVDDLIYLLEQYQAEYIPLDEEKRRIYYSLKREQFNKLKTQNINEYNVEKAALMIFLNRTCFNGLYRVNKRGLFNVPIGRYKSPCICDKNNLLSVSEKLKQVNIVCGDYKKSARFIDEHTFCYIDPPYRPLTSTASFTSYTKEKFDDEAQKELAHFVCEMSNKGAKILVSNADPKNADESDTFFDDIYSGYKIERVDALRMINCKSKNRGKIKELLISNF